MRNTDKKILIVDENYTSRIARSIDQEFRPYGYRRHALDCLYYGIEHPRRYGAVGARQAASLDNRANKVGVLNGLRMKSLHPACNHFRLSTRVALIARMRIDLVLLFWRTSFANSNPFISGRLRSRSMILGLFCLICLNASFPEFA